MSGPYPGRVTGGRPDLKPTQLDLDIRQLFDNRIVNESDLVAWCDQIKVVQRELSALEDIFSMVLPKSTEGHCGGLVVGNSGLLSYAFQIMSTQIEFSTNIGLVADRSLRIIKKVNKHEGSSEVRP